MTTSDRSAENSSDDEYVGVISGNDQLDPSETLTGDNTIDPLDAGYSPPDRPPHHWLGDTAEESREGESLDQHLAEEEPDVWDTDVDDLEPERRAGRLVAPDAGGLERTEAAEVAEDVGRAGSASSAEEAAVHVIDDDDLDGIDDEDES